MRKIVRIGRFQKCSSLQDVKSGKRPQHRMLDVVIEGVAVADAFQRKPGGRWNGLGELGVGRAKPAAHLLGKEGAQRLPRQLRNSNQGDALYPNPAKSGLVSGHQNRKRRCPKWGSASSARAGAELTPQAAATPREVAERSGLRFAFL